MTDEDEYIGDELSHEERRQVATKIIDKARSMGMPEEKAYRQVQAFGKIQRGVELLETDSIDELVEVVVLWRKMTGADNIDAALDEEQIRENMEMIAEIKEGEFNLPIEDDTQ